MPTFLVESYEPRGSAEEHASRARAAAAADGGRYIRSIYAPQDELCLHIFESPSPERLEQAMDAAGFSYVCITEVAEFPTERSRQ
jgi:hypothetical protein